MYYFVSRVETFAKLFFIISFVGFIMYVFLAFYTFHIAYFSKSHTKNVQKRIQSFPDFYNIAPLKHEYQSTKYILLWRGNNGITDNPIGEGQEPFIRYNCLHQNCHLTTDKELLGDYTEFHAIIFNATDLRRWNKTKLPLKRSWAQKYVFFSKRSSDSNPICSPQADNFFNWTWSYKLYSDIVSPFYEVKDLKGNVVAPSNNVVWRKYEHEELDFMKLNKTTKKKAVATVWKRCDIVRHMMTVVSIIKTLQLSESNLVFDQFGCGKNSCDKKCLKKIEENYFFYFVPDGMAPEDYVTDALLTAIETNTVPIVAGMSDYTKFLPPGSYLLLTNDTAEEMAYTLSFAIENMENYLKYFRWKKYYTFHKTPEFQGLCQLCSNLNNPTLMERRTHYQMFRRWWTPGPLNEMCLTRKSAGFFYNADDEQEWKMSHYNRSKSSSLSRRKQDKFTKGKAKDDDWVIM